MPRAVIVDGRRYPTLTAAAYSMGLSRSALCHMLVERRPAIRGHRVRYEDEAPPTGRCPHCGAALGLGRRDG